MGLIRYQKFKRRQAVKGHIRVSCAHLGNACDVRAGDFSHTIRTSDDRGPMSETSNFAAYALAALSMSNGIEFTLEDAVSAQVAQNIETLSNIYDLWAIGRLAPLRLNLPNIVEEADAGKDDARSAGLMCMSGGIDSTYAAIQGINAGKVSAGMLIAGADYESAQTQGFKELNERVRSLTNRLGIPLEVLETDIRKNRLDWQMMHGLVLASCLTFRDGVYQRGNIALDHAGYQELVSHPWGNNSVLTHYFSSGRFEIEGIGRHARRFDKLAVIAEHDAALPNLLSVCFVDTSSGRNCGKCTKCVGTRVLFDALGIDDTAAFTHNGSLVEHINGFKIPEKGSVLKLVYIRISELVEIAPKGKVRDALVSYKSALRKKFEMMGLSG